MADRPQFDVVALQRGLFTTAKRWFTLAQVVRLFSVALGLASISPVVARFVPFGVLMLAVIGEALSWKSDRMKSLAERTLRLLEVADGQGTALSDREVADIAAESPSAVRAASAGSVGESYYAATVEGGATRVLQNLQESAWWTKHLSGGLLTLTVVSVAILTLLSMAFLVTSINLAYEAATLNVMARVVTATLMLVTSMGLFRMAVGYAALRDRARAAEARASAAEAAGADVFTALRILHEYQIGRACAPLIPDWFYRQRAATLNKLWASQQRSESASGGPNIHA